MTNEELTKAVSDLGCQIGANNQLLLQNVQAMIHKAEIQNRKKRRRKVGDVLLVSPGYFLCMSRVYDDGTNELFRLTDYLTGRHTVYILDFQGREKCEKFGIYFENERVWVVGNKKDLRPEYLLNCFIKSVGALNPSISRAVAGRILFDFFAVRIEQTENRVKIPILAGWNDGDFIHAGNMPFRPGTGFPDLPIFKKSFPSVRLTQEIMGLYFKEVGRISQWKDRLIISIYPFAGILSSTFNSFGQPIDFCINFVEIGDVDRKRICSWLKIFDRDFLLPYSLDVSDSYMEKLIGETNDEILICDANWQEEDSNYKKNKIKNNLKKVLNAMKKQGNCCNNKEFKSCFACVFFSGQKVLQKGVFNVWADEKICPKYDLYSLAFLEKKVMESVLSDFVIFVKNNEKMIWEKIVKIRKGSDSRYSVVAGVYDIYTQYWNEKGVCINQLLEIPEEIVWAEVFDECIENGDEILEEFIRAMRKNIKNFYALKKERMGKYRENAIYFSDEYIWIPTNIFDAILKKEKILLYRNDILLWLKEGGHIYTDINGYSRKILVSKIQFETYQLKKSLFDEPGKVKILDLARRGE